MTAQLAIVAMERPSQSYDASFPHEDDVDINRNDSVRYLAEFRVCDFCRMKKIRCDMVRPTCGTCLARSSICTYSTRKRKPGPLRRTSSVAGTPGHQHTSTDYFADRSLPRQEQAIRDGTDGRDCGSLVAPTAAVVSPLTHTGTPTRQISITGIAQTDGVPNSPSSSSTSTHDMLRPETESYLLDLYFAHFEKTFPLFSSHSKSCKPSTLDLPLRLKLAMFAIASRFVEQRRSWTLPSAAMFVTQAEAQASLQIFDTNEIKASFLLCLYRLSEALDWRSLAELGKLVRMAQMWSKEDFHHRHPFTASRYHAVEERRKIWWSILSLETCCNALTTTPRGLASGLQHVPLPHSSQIWEHLTQYNNSMILTDNEQYLDFGETSFWKAAAKLWDNSETRYRNLYFAVCGVMAAVTDHRFALHRIQRPDAWRRLRELTNDIACFRMVLPTWYFHPARCVSMDESDHDHYTRLDTLLTLSCADILLAITGAHLNKNDILANAGTDPENHWQNIVAKAADVVPYVQQWDPQHFPRMNPMSSYIIFLVVTILIISGSHSATKTVKASRTVFTTDVELLVNFLQRVGHHWPIGNRLAGTVYTLQHSLVRGVTAQEATEVVWSLATKPDMHTPFPPVHNIVSQGMNRVLEENTEIHAQHIQEGRDLDGMEWLDDVLLSSLYNNTNNIETLMAQF